MNSRPLLLLTVLVAAACGDGTGPSSGGNRHPLEAIDYAALDGAIMFARIGGDGAFEAYYVVDPVTRQATQVLDTVGSLLSYPALSPGQDKIAYLRWTDASDCFDVYVSAFDGAQAQRLSNFTCNSEGAPAWTRDGAAVLFPAFAWGGSPPAYDGIFKRTLAGSAVTTLFRRSDASPCELSNSITVTAAGTVYLACGLHIWVGVPGDTLKPLQPGTDDAVQTLAVSADGASIAYPVFVNDGESRLVATQLRRLDIATGEVTTLATIPAFTGAGAWSSSSIASVCWLRGGRRLAFTAPASGTPMRAHVYVVGRDGQGLTQVTTAPSAFDHDVTCAA